jgi:hypothetical protein
MNGLTVNNFATCALFLEHGVAAILFRDGLGAP